MTLTTANIAPVRTRLAEATDAVVTIAVDADPGWKLLPVSDLGGAQVRVNAAPSASVSHTEVLPTPSGARVVVTRAPGGPQLRMLRLTMQPCSNEVCLAPLTLEILIEANAPDGAIDGR